MICGFFLRKGIGNFYQNNVIINRTEEWLLLWYKTCSPESCIDTVALDLETPAQEGLWCLSNMRSTPFLTVVFCTGRVNIHTMYFLHSGDICSDEHILLLGHIRVPGISSSFSVLCSLMEEILQLQMEERQTWWGVQGAERVCCPACSVVTCTADRVDGVSHCKQLSCTEESWPGHIIGGLSP